MSRSLLGYLCSAGLVSVLLLSPFATAETPQLMNQGTIYPNTSWALGVVVREGSALSGGGGLRWESVGNVTAVVSLPNITDPDRVVYSVLSVMTSDGGVMQVAAGIYPNRTTWLTYSWEIPNADSSAPTYSWVLNGSSPSLNRNTTVVMSIFRGSGSWDLRVTDRDTGIAVVRQFPVALAPSLKVGDQEVFALESYSRASATFREMGNMTLDALLVDGQKVTGGFYSYGDWDPDHNPVFAVGSSGTAPPGFISLEKMGTGSFAWGFSRVWQGQSLDSGGDVVTAVVVGALVVIISAVALAIRTTRKSAG